MKPIIIKPSEEFTGYCTHRIDEKGRINIPSKYCEVIAKRNTFKRLHGLEKGLFDLNSTGVSYLGHSLDTPDKKIRMVFLKRLYIRRFVEQPDLQKRIDGLIYIVELRGENKRFRCYPYFDWIEKITDLEENIRSLEKLELKENRINLPPYVKAELDLGNEVGLYGNIDHFLITKPHPNIPAKEKN